MQDSQASQRNTPRRDRAATGLRLVFLGLVLVFFAWNTSALQTYAQEEGAAVPQSRFQEAQQALSNQFAPNRSRNVYFLIFATVFGVGVIATAILIERHYHSRSVKGGFYSEEELFGELCRAHEFTFYQQRALRSVAKELRLIPPGEIFIEPRHLETALKEQVVPYPRETLQEIYKALFSANLVVEKTTEDKTTTTSWFAWTSIVDNPNPELLAHPTQGSPESSEGADETRAWDPSLWDDVHRVARAVAREEDGSGGDARSDRSDTPVFASPPLEKETEDMETTAFHVPLPLSSQGYYGGNFREKGETPRRSLLDRRDARPAVFERPQNNEKDNGKDEEEQDNDQTVLFQANSGSARPPRSFTSPERASYKPRYPDGPEQSQ